MKRFSKKTIALVLASVVTVAGAFGANNYKNCLKDLQFENTPNGAINMVLHTSAAYTGNLSLMRRDANTFVLTLPEVTSQVKAPDLSSVSHNITSVNVRTMPYTNNSNGYTRITVKTNQPALNLTASHKLFIESAENKLLTTAKKEDLIEESSQNDSQTQIEQTNNIAIKPKKTIETVEKKQNTNETVAESKPVEVIEQTSQTNTSAINQQKNMDSLHGLYALFWVLIIILCSYFFYVKAKNKMVELSGEKLELNIDEEPKPKEKEQEKEKEKKKETKKFKKIAKTVSKLNSTYKNTPINNTPITPEIRQSEIVIEAQENLDIIDLDELYREQLSKTSSQEEEENQALEEFLSGFSFNEFEDNIIEASFEEENDTFDEELLERTLNNDNLNFSKDDIHCINKLLELEINDDTLRNANKYLASNPIKKPSKKEILENIVTTYAISQNIIFSSSDIEILNKLISIEIDNDFITDLRTNLSKTEKEESTEIKSYESENDDLDPEFGSYFASKAESEIETKVDNYGASVLVLDVDLPDLSAEINKKDAFAERPSAKYEVVDDSYSVGDNIIKDVANLPDMSDAVKNPNKYMSQKEVFVASEETLLKNIENVTFKSIGEPDNNQVIDIEEFVEKTTILNTQEELKDFNETAIKPTEKQINQPEPVKNDTAPKEENFPNTRTTTADILMNRLQSARKLRQNSDRKQEEINKSINKPVQAHIEPVMTVFNGKSYAILNSIALNKNIGCHLAKNENGYVIFGYIGDNVINIKQYDDLKSEKMQARLYETFEDNTMRYIIKIGVQKFVVDTKDNNIEFVMDL